MDSGLTTMDYNGLTTMDYSTILIFKTNIHQRDMLKVASVMNAEERILKWNVDCSDVDHVLRVEARALRMDDVIDLVHRAGFTCEELVD